MKQLTSPRDICVNGLDATLLNQIQTQRELELSVQFGERSKRNAYVLQVSPVAMMRMPLGNVARHRCSRPSNLGTELESLRRGQESRETMSRDRKIHGYLPSVEVTKTEDLS